MRGARDNQHCNRTFVHHPAAANGDFGMASDDLHFCDLRARFGRVGNRDSLALAFRRISCEAAHHRNRDDARFGFDPFRAPHFVRIHADSAWRRIDDFGGRNYGIRNLEKPRHRYRRSRSQRRRIKALLKFQGFQKFYFPKTLKRSRIFSEHFTNLTRKLNACAQNPAQL